MARVIIAFSNHKGGSTKTTSCASVAVALRELGHSPILLVDCDPTGALSASFGVFPKSGEKTIYHGLFEDGTSIKDVVRKVRDGIDLAPANADLTAAEIMLTHEAGGELVLKEALENLADVYPFILLDCPPNLGKLNIAALAAADRVVIPTTPAYLSLHAMLPVSNTIKSVTKRLNPNLRILGILLTQFSNRIHHAQEVEERLKAIFPGLLFSVTVPPSVRFQEAPAGGQTILEYEPSHPGALAYREIAKEILQRVYQEANHAAVSGGPPLQEQSADRSTK